MRRVGFARLFLDRISIHPSVGDWKPPLLGLRRFTVAVIAAARNMDLYIEVRDAETCVGDRSPPRTMRKVGFACLFLARISIHPSVGGWKPPLLGLRRFTVAVIAAARRMDLLIEVRDAETCVGDRSPPGTMRRVGFARLFLDRISIHPSVGGWKPPLLGLRRFTVAVIAAARNMDLYIEARDAETCV